MNIGKDKSTFPMPMWMPMDTHGRDLGYSLRLQLPLSERHTLQVGNEFHRFALDDTWPPVPGADPYMGPNEFVDINGGHRVRLGSFAEAASKWNSKWTTLLGVRNDTVWTNAGPVSGYSETMMYAPDAAAFNAQSHARNDVNFDLTALARYQRGRTVSFEAGYARKTRSPNLYERYAWSTNWMASGMINWFGDGNYYVGNLDLKPEVAHTLSGTASFHDPVRQRWEVRATPYWTHIRDYIGVDQLATTTYGESTFAQLQFANQSARIYGVDLSGDVALWDSATLGRAAIRGVAGWRRGTVLATGEGMYHIMPPNARLTLDETRGAWTGAVELELVDRKSRVDPLRFEQPTAGYALLDLRTGYRWRRLGVEAGARNVLNRYYYLPLGGVNFDAFMASGWSGRVTPLAGPGRSVYTGLGIHF
jgi:iron complex outermembrane receptor protein